MQKKKNERNGLFHLTTKITNVGIYHAYKPEKDKKVYKCTAEEKIPSTESMHTPSDSSWPSKHRWIIYKINKI